MRIPDFLALRTNSSHSPQETSWLQQRNVKPKRVLFHPQKRKRIIHYLWQKCNLTRQFVWQVTGERWDTERSSQEACTGLETLGAPGHTFQLQSGQPFTKHIYSIWMETYKNGTAPSKQTVRWTHSPNALTHFISQRLYTGVNSVFTWKTNKQTHIDAAELSNIPQRNRDRALTFTEGWCLFPLCHTIPLKLDFSNHQWWLLEAPPK